MLKHVFHIDLIPVEHISLAVTMMVILTMLENHRLMLLLNLDPDLLLLSMNSYPYDAIYLSTQKKTTISSQYLLESGKFTYEIDFLMNAAREDEQLLAF